MLDTLILFVLQAVTQWSFLSSISKLLMVVIHFRLSTQVPSCRMTSVIHIEHL